MARIGETLDQVLKRYGRGLRTVTAENGMVYKLFSKSGFKILVHFYENKVDEISYGSSQGRETGSCRVLAGAVRRSDEEALRLRR